MNLSATPIDQLVSDCLALSCSRLNDPALSAATASVVVSPYRFNPLGAHVDHQGGQVMARTLDQYSVLVYWSVEDPVITVHGRLGESWEAVTVGVDISELNEGWPQMLQASVAAMAAEYQIKRGIIGVVHGTLVSSGLSSSASVVLAYLSALAAANDLNNGIQDQMSIAFGSHNAMSVLDVNAVEANVIADPVGIEHVQFLLCFSGVTRDLAGSGFNTRVAECREAARLLDVSATHLGEVGAQFRTEDHISRLPSPLARRAKHVYTEMARVERGATAWAAGDFNTFGQLMNESCLSSINDYESGSEWLIALHEIARELPGVLGNRFSGGGYGGCLFMLVESSQIETVAEALLSRYRARYPELNDKPFVRIARSEGAVRHSTS